MEAITSQLCYVFTEKLPSFYPLWTDACRQGVANFFSALCGFLSYPGGLISWLAAGWGNPPASRWPYGEQKAEQTAGSTL